MGSSSAASGGKDLSPESCPPSFSSTVALVPLGPRQQHIDAREASQELGILTQDVAPASVPELHHFGVRRPEPQAAELLPEE